MVVEKTITLGGSLPGSVTKVRDGEWGMGNGKLKNENEKMKLGN